MAIGEAMAEADATFRSTRDPRLATIRNAYREHFAQSSNPAKSSKNK
jgi:hypothetical protein